MALLLLSKSTSGDIYVERELCVPNLTLGEAADAITTFIEGCRVEYAVASPDLWNRRQDSGKSGFEIMQSTYGMPPMAAADDRRVPGWRVLKEYLSAREGKPRLYISESCVELIHSMQSLLCDKNRAEDAANAVVVSGIAYVLGSYNLHATNILIPKNKDVKNNGRPN